MYFQLIDTSIPVNFVGKYCTFTPLSVFANFSLWKHILKAIHFISRWIGLNNTDSDSQKYTDYLIISTQISSYIYIYCIQHIHPYIHVKVCIIYFYFWNSGTSITRKLLFILEYVCVRYEMLRGLPVAVKTWGCSLSSQNKLLKLPTSLPPPSPCNGQELFVKQHTSGRGLQPSVIHKRR